MKKFNKVLVYCALIVSLFCIVTLIVVGINDLPLKVEKGLGTKEFNSSWVGEDNNTYNAPFRYNAKYKETISMYNTIPLDFEDGEIIYIKMNYCSLKAYVDGVEVKVNQVDSTIKTNLPWSSIEIPNGSQGKQIQIDIQNNGSKFHIEVHTIIYENIDVIKFKLSNSIIHTIELVSVMMVIAISLVVAACFSFKKYRDESINQILVAAFTTLSAAWVIVDSNIQGIYFIGSETVLIINNLVFFLIPLPVIFYIKRMTKIKPVLFNIAIIIELVAVVGYCFEFLLRTFSPAISLLISHIYIAIIMVLIFYASTLQFIREYKKKLMARFIALCIFGLSSFLTLVNFHFTIDDDNTSFFRYGIVIYIIIIFGCTIFDAIRKVKDLNAIEKTMLMESEYKIMSKQTDKLVFKYDYSLNSVSFFNEDRKLIETTPEEIVRNGYIVDDSLRDYLVFLRNLRSGLDCTPILLQVENYKSSLAWYHVEYELIKDNYNNLIQAVVTAFDATDIRLKEQAYNEANKRVNKTIEEGGGSYLYNLTTDKFIKSDDIHSNDKLVIGKSMDYFVGLVLKLMSDPTERELFKSIFSRERLYGLYGKQNSKKVQTFTLNIKNEVKEYLFGINVIMSPYSHDIIVFIIIEENKKIDSVEGLIDKESGLQTFEAFKKSVSNKLSISDPTNCHTMMLIEVSNYEDIINDKGIDDTNKIIKKLANNINAFTRQTDDAARIASNKFALYLQYTSNDQTILKKMIEQKSDAIRKVGSDATVKLCISISRYAKDGQLFDELYDKAYDGLEKAKEGKQKFYICE